MMVLIHEKDIVRIKPNYILGDPNLQTHDPNLTPLESLEYVEYERICIRIYEFITNWNKRLLSDLVCEYTPNST